MVRGSGCCDALPSPADADSLLARRRCFADPLAGPLPFLLLDLLPLRAMAQAWLGSVGALSVRFLLLSAVGGCRWLSLTVGGCCGLWWVG